MFLKNYQDIVNAIKTITLQNYKDFFMVGKDAFPIEKILVQKLSRNINGKELDFLSIRDISIQQEHQQQGIFTSIINHLEENKIPTMINDIINDELDNFLQKRGYVLYVYEKNLERIRSRYKLYN